MTKPVKNKKAIITSGYGDRTIPDGKKEFHAGIDIAVPNSPAGVPIYSTCAGVIVAFTSKTASCGNSVFIKRDGTDYYCLYMHMDFINPDLAINDKVVDGTYLGAMGNTGESRGVHLHYAHRKTLVSGGETYNPIEVSNLYL